MNNALALGFKDVTVDVDLDSRFKAITIQSIKRTCKVD
jgi:hypothetical protein